MEPEIVIAVMGATGTGKSSFINLVSGADLAVGHTLHSCTDQIQQSQPFELDGRSVVLVDTPGFDDSRISDTEVLKMLAVYLASTYEHGFKLSGVLCLHRISDVRVGGISRKNFRMLRELCGEKTLCNVSIVTTMWGQIQEEKGAAREEELKSSDTLFKPMLERGARFVRHDNSLETARAIVADLANRHPRALRIQEELVDEGIDITETAAGLELHRELLMLKDRHEKELAAIMEESTRVMMERNVRIQEGLVVEREELKQRLRTIETELDKARLSLQYMEEKKSFTEDIRQIVAAYQAERRHRTKAEKEVKRLQDKIARQQNPRSGRMLPKRSTVFGMIGRLLGKRMKPR